MVILRQNRSKRRSAGMNAKQELVLNSTFHARFTFFLLFATGMSFTGSEVPRLFRNTLNAELLISGLHVSDDGR